MPRAEQSRPQPITVTTFPPTAMAVRWLGSKPSTLFVSDWLKARTNGQEIKVYDGIDEKNMLIIESRKLIDGVYRWQVPSGSYVVLFMGSIYVMDEKRLKTAMGLRG